MPVTGPEIYFPYSSDNLIHVTPLKLVDSFNDWFDKSNQIIAALNPLNMFDVAGDGGLQHSDTFSEIEINRGPGVRVNIYNELTVDIVGLQAAEVFTNPDADTTTDDILVPDDAFFMMETNHAGGAEADPTKLRKVQAAFMLPQTIYGDHIFAGDITFINDFSVATTQNFRVEDQQLELAVPFNEQGIALPRPDFNSTDALLGGNKTNRAGIAVLGKTEDPDRQQIKFAEDHITNETYVSGHYVIQGANQVFANDVHLTDDLSGINANGALGWAGYFGADGHSGYTGSYIEVVQPPSGPENFHLTGDWQIDGWFRPTGTASKAIVERWGTGGDESFRLEYVAGGSPGTTGFLQFHYKNEAGATGTVTGYVDDMTEGTSWKHIVVAGVSGHGIAMYKNNVRIGHQIVSHSGTNLSSTAGATNLATGHANDPLLIGAKAVSGGSIHPLNSTSNMFLGAMSSVRLRSGSTHNPHGITGVNETTMPNYSDSSVNVSGDEFTTLYLPFDNTITGPGATTAENRNGIFDTRGVYGIVDKYVTGKDLDDFTLARFASGNGALYSWGSGGSIFNIGEEVVQIVADTIVGTGEVVSMITAGEPFTTTIEVKTGYFITGVALSGSPGEYATDSMISGTSSGATGTPSNVVGLDKDALLVIDGVTEWTQDNLTGPTGFSITGGTIFNAGCGTGGSTLPVPWTTIGNASMGATTGDYISIEAGWMADNKEWTFNYGSDGADTTTLGGAWRTTEHIEFEGTRDNANDGEWPKGMYSSVSDIPIYGNSARDYSGIRFTNVGDSTKGFKVRYNKTAASTGKNALHYTYMISGGTANYPGPLSGGEAGTEEVTGWIMNPDGTHYVPVFSTTGQPFSDGTYAEPPRKRDAAGTLIGFNSITHGDSFARYARPYNVPVADQYGVLNHSWVNREVITSRTHGGDITPHGFITGMAVRRFRTDQPEGGAGDSAKEWVRAFGSQVTSELATGEEAPYSATNPNATDATINSEALGIVSRVHDVNTFEICYSGPISFTTGEIAAFLDKDDMGNHPVPHEGANFLLPGEPYFVSVRPGQTGRLTEEEPDNRDGKNIGNVRKVMMVATSQTTAVVVNYSGGVIPDPATGTPDDIIEPTETYYDIVKDGFVPDGTDILGYYGNTPDGTNQENAGNDNNPDPATNRRFLEVNAGGNLFLRKLHISGPDIGAGQVTGMHFGVGELDGSLHIKDKSITEVKIGDLEISGALIKDNAILQRHLNDNIVGTDELEDGSVTQAKLAFGIDWEGLIACNTLNGCVITDAPFGISSSKINPGAVNSSHIQDGSIQGIDIGTTQITGGHLSTTTDLRIKTDNIDDLQISRSKIKDLAIDWSKIDKDNFGTVLAGHLKVANGKLSIDTTLSSDDDEVNTLYGEVNFFESQKPGVSGGTDDSGNITSFTTGTTRTNVPGLHIRRLNKMGHHPRYAMIGPLNNDNPANPINTTWANTGDVELVQDAALIEYSFLTADQIGLDSADYQFDISVPIGDGENFGHRAVLLAHMPDRHGTFPNGVNYKQAGDGFYNTRPSGFSDGLTGTYPQQFVNYVPLGNVSVDGITGFYPVMFGSNAGPGEASVMKGNLRVPHGPAKFFVATQVVAKRTDFSVLGTQTLTLDHDGTPAGWEGNFATGGNNWIYQITGGMSLDDSVGAQVHDLVAMGRLVDILSTGNAGNQFETQVLVEVYAGEFHTGGNAGQNFSAGANVYPRYIQPAHDHSQKINATSGGIDTSGYGVSIRGNWGLPLQDSSGKSAPLSGGWVTGSEELYTQFNIKQILAPEFASTTTGGSTWQIRNGVCCCVNAGGTAGGGNAAFNVVGVSFDECQQLLNQYDNRDSANVDVDISRRYISGADIVFNAPYASVFPPADGDPIVYDETNTYSIEGNCYPSIEVITETGASNVGNPGPSGGAHDSSDYANIGGCYVN